MGSGTAKSWISQGLLPKVVNSSEIGKTDLLLGTHQYYGIAKDQQAALFGQLCLNRGC